MSTVAQLVRQARKNAGLTQTELAERVGVVQGNISMIERGVHVPGPETAVALEEALGPDCCAEKLNRVLLRFTRIYEARRARGHKT